jgi:hypothetical protein
MKLIRPQALRELRGGPRPRHPSRRRHLGRGSALLEAVVVATTLISLLALGMLIHRQHVRTLTAARDARSTAWQRGLDGCERATDFRGMSERVIRGALPSSTEQLVTHTSAAWMSGQGTAVLELAPCNETPRALALSGLGPDLDRQLLLLPRRGY